MKETKEQRKARLRAQRLAAVEKAQLLNITPEVVKIGTYLFDWLGVINDASLERDVWGRLLIAMRPVEEAYEKEFNGFNTADAVNVAIAVALEEVAPIDELLKVA